MARHFGILPLAANAVTSLNGETGNVVLTSNGGTIDITKPTSGTINLEVDTQANGILSLNADVTSTQFLTVGASGTDFGIFDNGTGTHIFNLPLASSLNTGKLSNTDWTNFNNKVPSTRNIITAAPLIGGGDLSIDRTIGITQANPSTNGYLSSTDWITFNNKFTLPSFTNGSVLFSDGSTIVQNNGSFFWDIANTALNIGTNTTPTSTIFNVASTTKGSIASPKMSTTQVNTISTPVEGSTVYDTVLHNLYYFNGSIWTTFGFNTIGTIDSQSKSANGITTVGNSLYMQSADTSFPGLVTTGTQSFGGVKTFIGQVNMNSGTLITGIITANRTATPAGSNGATQQINNLTLTGNTNTTNGGFLNEFIVNFNNTGSNTYQFSNTAGTGMMGLGGSTAALAGYIQVSNTGSLTDSQAFASIFTLSNAGNITNAVGFRCEVASATAAGRITNYEGFRCEDQTLTAVVTGNIYGYRGRVSAGTNKYNLFMDGTAQNLLNGALIVNNTVTATAFLGNATTATALSPGNTINGVTFTGASPIIVAAAAGTLTGTTLASNVVTSSLTSVGKLTNMDIWTSYISLGFFEPAPNTANISQWGLSILTSGTATAIPLTATNLFTGTQRVDYITAAGAGSSASVRYTQFIALRGINPGEGGFKFVTRVGAEINVANSRAFFGILNSTAVIPNADPSTIINMIGVGWDATDTSLQVMSNDGTGVATKISLGANFPNNTSAVDLYQIELTALANASGIDWFVTRLNTSQTASGTIVADIPANNLLLAPQVWMSNGTTAAPLTAAFCGGWIAKPH